MYNDITAIVLTYNEELHIERCITRLASLCQKIYVIDSFSTDSTCDIARRLGAVVLQNHYINQAQQFQWALDNCAVDTEWVLRMDADEYLSNELIEEIQQKIPSFEREITGCYLPLRVVFMEKMLKYGLPHRVRILRLWRKGCVFIEQRWMDERCVLTKGKSVNMNGSFIDHNLKGLAEFTQKHNNYSNREVLMELNKRYHFVDEKVSADLKSRNNQKGGYYRLPKFLRAFFYFFLRYFVFLGFLDGLRGLIWLTLQAYWYRFLIDAKIYEVETKLGKDATSGDVKDFLRNMYGVKI